MILLRDQPQPALGAAFEFYTFENRCNFGIAKEKFQTIIAPLKFAGVKRLGERASGRAM
jgi:hypothetical protein